MCPDRDDGYHLGLNEKDNKVSCFRCGYSATLKYFLKKYKIRVKVNYYRESSKTHSYPVRLPAKFVPIEDVVQGSTFWLEGHEYSVDTFLNYVEKRIGITLARRLGVGICFHGKHAWRVVVPSYSRSGRLEHFISRAVLDEIEPKVLNPYGPKTTIYNFSEATQFKEIYLVEGVFGAISMYPYGTALYGKNCNDSQLWSIVRSDVKVINILLDGNAVNEAYKLADRILALTSKIKLRVLKLGYYEQPDDLPFHHKISIRNETPFYTRFNK